MSEPGKAVFLSYASQDTEAAKRICDALRAAGVEVWFDQNELVGGDQWDGKIRGQIGSCALFVPVISANTQARLEGYFRLEWKIAALRTHTMADEKAFLLPVVIDATRDSEAKVPAEFKSVQWTKLMGGETPPAFAGRVQKLLGGTVAGVATSATASAADPGPAPGSASPATSRPLSSKSRPWLIPAILGVAALAALALWAPWEKAATPTPPVPTATAALTPAQQLVAQARQIYEGGDELNRDNLSLAEELVQRALALDPTEPSAWELATWLSYWMHWHSIDDTQARRETLLRQANRAVALAPDSVAAQLVFANAQLAGRFTSDNASPGSFAPIEASLKQLAEREPQNWKIQRALGSVYRITQRLDEAIRAFNRAIKLSGGHPMATADLVNLLIRRVRYAEAEALLAQGLAHHRSGRLLTFNLIVQCRWRGEVESAAQAIADWPDWLLQQDRGIAVAWQAALWARQPDLALRLVQQFSRPYVRDITFSGPRVVLSARAQELAGNTVAAQADWRAVLQQCDQDLAANASDLTALYWKAWAHARLGDQTGAQAAATLLRQRLPSVPNKFIFSYTAAALWAIVGWTDVAVTTLQAELQHPTDYISLTRAGLELEPAFDPIRQDPRFIALLLQAPALQRTAAAAPKVDEKSVAVLAFANLSDDKANEYFSDGISEELLNVLAKVPGLKVSARTSAFYFKGKEVPVPEIARQLGVAYVVEGSVRKAGDKVRITAQLIKADGGFHVWSDTFTRDLKDIFAVQDEIAGLIVKELSLKLGVSSGAATAAVKPAALELYMRARQAWNLRTPQGFAQADEMLNRALALAPNFAPAYALLAQTWTTRDASGGIIGPFGQRTSPAFTRIQSQIDHALALEPNLAEAHTAQGILNWHRWKFDDAERELRLAIALNPNDATAHHYLGRVLLTVGRIDEADAALQRAADLDPFSHSILDNRAIPLRFAGRFAESLAFEERALTLQSDALQPNWFKAIDLSWLGRHDEAVTLLRRLPLDGTIGAATSMGVFVKAGLRAEAEQRLAGVTVERKFVALAHLGRYEEVLAALDPATVPASVMQSVLFEPQYDPIRSEPRFVNFLAIIGLTEAHARAQAWRKAHPPEK